MTWLDDLPLLAAALPARGEDDVADEGESDDAPEERERYEVVAGA